MVYIKVVMFQQRGDNDPLTKFNSDMLSTSPIAQCEMSR